VPHPIALVQIIDLLQGRQIVEAYSRGRILPLARAIMAAFGRDCSASVQRRWQNLCVRDDVELARHKY
jgi:hypothetical protein